MNVDAAKTLLAVKNDQHLEEEWAYMYRHAPLFLDRWEAVDHLQTSPTPLARAVMQEALADKSWAIRLAALQKADMSQAAVLAQVAKMAENDPEPGVRATAIQNLGQTNDTQYVPIFQKSMTGEQPYSVLGAALGALSKIDAVAAIAAAKNLENDDNESIVLTLAQLYAEHPSASMLPWFQKNAVKIDNMAAFGFYDAYSKCLTGLNDPAAIDQAVSGFKVVSYDGSTSLWRRFANTKAIADLRNHYLEAANKDKADELSKLLADIREKETDPTLKLYYSMFDQP